MNLIVRIPDELAARLEAHGGNLERRVIEALVPEEFRAGRMTKPELRRALGFEALDEVDGFLKAHGVFEVCTVEEIDRDVETLARPGAAARTLDQTMAEARSKFADLPAAEVEAMVSEAVAAVRKERRADEC